MPRKKDVDSQLTSLAAEAGHGSGSLPPVFMPPPPWVDPEGTWEPVQHPAPGTRKATKAELAAAGKAHREACKAFLETPHRHVGPAVGCRACLRHCARHGQEMPCHGLAECTPTTFLIEHVDEVERPVSSSPRLDDGDTYGLPYHPQDREAVVDRYEAERLRLLRIAQSAEVRWFTS